MFPQSCVGLLLQDSESRYSLPAMPKRSSKPSTDENVAAFAALSKLTGEDKNPAAVALGRLGGLKGGKARAKKLSAKRRVEIAKKAASARWKQRRRPRSE